VRSQESGSASDESLHGEIGILIQTAIPSDKPMYKPIICGGRVWMRSELPLPHGQAILHYGARHAWS
jgi:hypothetical protein